MYLKSHKTLIFIQLKWLEYKEKLFIYRVQIGFRKLTKQTHPKRKNPPCGCEL